MTTKNIIFTVIAVSVIIVVVWIGGMKKTQIGRAHV